MIPWKTKDEIPEDNKRLVLVRKFCIDKGYYSFDGFHTDSGWVVDLEFWCYEKEFREGIKDYFPGKKKEKI